MDNVAGIASNEEEGAVNRLRNDWLALLEERRRVESANDMSSWLMRVFAVAEQSMADRNNNISDDDDGNNHAGQVK